MVFIEDTPRLLQLLGSEDKPESVFVSHVDVDNAVVDLYRQLMQEHTTLKLFSVTNKATGNVAGLLDLVPESSTVEKIFIMEGPIGPPLDAESLLPALDRALANSQTMSSVDFHVIRDLTANVSDDAWDEFTDGMSRCHNLKSVLFRIPGPETRNDCENCPKHCS